ncbi:DUF3995 domain-containing protein [Achromobacter ruhlandii]|uniref:DUF3995 domain-containing protein n=1 Tax=Achromobacter ruhlandii TaxID=72557 RepID=A0ABM8LWV0_9BURK|nr:DUF3995 domain-containing protein [Achromobacter ruhlandii]AKP91775.1 hypothetical protein Axylo_4314 [Achromobacter xylosoxidans]AOU95009.1 DUF3995 domain-containing protein [Achromobacter ruhlandii]MCZ8431609.1 DUF3995 domain-containing protein [Achromobacter ruhlandii]MDC6091782.1 DUF3995 domain-containing protein [Achromobacter ruhlandii]MDC6149529.1 DUF3995 domain-containing protein [Achromobacter ruhlandii]
MQAIAAAVTAIVFVVLGLWHAYWAAGGRLAHRAALPIQDGQPLFRPSPLGTLAVAAALIGCAWITAANGGLVTAPPLRWLPWLGMAVALGLLARAIGDFRYVGFFKRKGEDPFARLDTRFYSPLCLLLAAGVALASWPGLA